MNWNNFQLERLLWLRLYAGLTGILIKFFGYLLGLIGLILLILTPIFHLTSGFLALGLALTPLLLLIITFNIYVDYLRRHPTFLISKEDLKNPLNRLTWPALRVLRHWRSHQNWQELAQALYQDDSVIVAMYRLGITQDSLKPLLRSSELGEPEMEKLLAGFGNQEVIGVYDLARLLMNQSAVSSYLKSIKLSVEQANDLLGFYQEIEQRRLALGEMTNQRFRTGGFARDWSIAYTNFLDRFTQELLPETAPAIQFTPIFERSSLVDQIITELNKSAGHNLMIVGEAGVGKKELFYQLAARAMSYQTKSRLDGKQVRLLNVAHLLAEAKSSAQIESVFEQLFFEINHAGNILLFIDQIDLLLNPSGEVGTLNVGALLQNYLANKQTVIIGAITKQSYTQFVRSNPTLSGQFSTVEVSPPTAQTLLKILLFHLPGIESRYNTLFSLESLEILIELAARYIKDSFSPRREIDLAEEVAVSAQAHSVKYVTEKDVTAVVEKEAQVPLEVSSGEQEKLLNLEGELHQRVVGQDRAIKLVSDALLRARAGLTTGKKPIGSFLFLGPTGVGKTETAKALAQIYFGNEAKMIRLDMTEYADANGLLKLLGSDPANQPGTLTLKIQETPSTVLLLDEIEKSNEQVKNVFLQLLDEGRLTTNYGRVLDFTNTIVIATSNAGSDYIKTKVESGVAAGSFEKDLIDQLISQRIFLPEFLNRFDGVVVYLPLRVDEVKKVVAIQLQQLKARLKQEKGLDLEISSEVVDTLVQKGYDPVFGARALERIMKEDLETAIAREVIAQSPQPGSSLQINKI